ncbi:MAG TPA: MFS transporter [Rhizomicrobium sp.]|nr:MFS transporter [Rhizomicrobium sp.]
MAIDIIPEIEAASVSPSTEPWPSPVRAWYAIFVFALALMMNFLDRGIVGLLVHPLEVDLHLSDSQIGLVTGVAYIAFYAAIGLPIARFADVGVRRTIVGIGITVWSLATAFCGLASTFWQLFIARMGVGAGEACNGPPVFSMISDLFPRDKLPLAIAVLNFGFIFGNGLANILGGTVIYLLQGTPSLTLPVLGTLHTWQLVFIAVGLPGLLVAILMFTLKEPERRGRIAKDGVHVGVPVREVVRFYLDNIETYWPMFAALAFNIIPAIGLIIWGPEYIRRSFGWSTAQFATTAGVITMIVAPFGAIFGGWLAGHFQRRGHDDANLRVVLLAFFLNIFGLLGFTLAPNVYFALGAFAYIQFVAMWVPGPFNAALQVVTPNEMRSQITALFLFIFNIIGFGIGPSAVPWVTRLVFHDPAMLGRGFAVVIAVLCPLSALCIFLGLKPYGRAIARSRAWG